MSFLNLKDVTADQGMSFDPIPKGKYLLRCVEAKLRDTKDGEGKYINCQFKVDEGEMANRRVFHIFNIANPSSEAERIGKAQLKAFLIGAAYFDPDDLKSLDDLIGLKCNCIVGLEKSSQYGDKNKITSFNVKKEEEKVSKPF